MGLGKGGQFSHGTGVLHAPTRHDHRALGGFQKGCRLGNLKRVGRLTADAVDTARKERLRVVVSPALQILRQADEGGAAIGGVKHRGQGGGQGLQDLRRVRDAVPIAADGFEGVIHAKGRVPEMLKLLQHRVGQAGQKGIAAQHQHRKAVGMGQSCGGQQVGRPRPGTGGAEHEAPPQVVFGISGGRKAHALLILAAIKRHILMHRIKRLAQAGHIAMAKDAKAAAANAGFHPVNFDELVHQPAHNRLGHGESDGFLHGHMSFIRAPTNGACAAFRPRIHILQPVAISAFDAGAGDG